MRGKFASSPFSHWWGPPAGPHRPLPNNKCAQMRSLHHPVMRAMEHYFVIMKCCVLFYLLLNCSCSLGLPKYPHPAGEVGAYYPVCSTDKFGANTPYQSNLFTLLSSLSSNATASTEFYNATVGIQKDPNSTVCGLFMCRGDIPHDLCQQCVSNATRGVASGCPLAKQATIVNIFCFVRYSNRNFLSRVEEELTMFVFHADNDHHASFAWTLANPLNPVAGEAASYGPAGAEKFATREAHVSERGPATLYTLARCTPDLSFKDCGRCLHDAIQNIAGCCLDGVGGRATYPSCKIRFELYQFYCHVSPIPLCSPGGPALKGRRKIESQMIVVIVVTVIVSVVLLGLGAYFLRKRAKAVLRKLEFFPDIAVGVHMGCKSHKKQKNENLLGDAATATLRSLQFNLATIETATNKFSPENKIGKGGFGGVYKGILSNGQEIAVKRLSNHSSQGLMEFKNEILLIPKLQHRNLVKLIGFYLDEQEKILVYEYVPNKSLDYFLFDPQKERQLSWFERYQIIGGIAQAILYLHEHSRLKVIHCDLKPGNILLDNNINPKISDFGTAKTIAIDKVHGRTSRIVGTRGYMSPEYAKFGEFSEKSDIFSFGVILLEIITGKRNTSNELQYVNGLLNHVWNQWSEQTPLQILDSNVKDSHCEAEVTKCIQIGLLCVQEDSDARPPMSTVVSYISSFSVKLPPPQEPAFHDYEESRLVVQAAANNPMPCSPNNITMSCLFPR